MSPKEHQPHIDLDREAVQQFTAAFISRFDRYPLQRSDGRYTAIQQMLTIPLIEAHILGKRTLGAYALDTHSQAKWICFDADDDDTWHSLTKMSRSLERKHISSYLELSRRGGHLWLFFDPLPGGDARRFGKRLLADNKLNGIELYPKQDQLQTGPGSLVRLPLGIHQKDHKRYYFVTHDGSPLAPSIREQLAILSHPSRVPNSFVRSVLSRAPDSTPHFPTARLTPLPDHAYGGKPSDKIKHRISVFDFVSQFVDLDRRGIGLCPFHDDHLQTFGVNQEGNYWHCFAGCGGGSVIDFWMRWRKLHDKDDNFTATIKELSEMLLK